MELPTKLDDSEIDHYIEKMFPSWRWFFSPPLAKSYAKTVIVSAIEKNDHYVTNKSTADNQTIVPWISKSEIVHNILFEYGCRNVQEKDEIGITLFARGFHPEIYGKSSVVKSVAGYVERYIDLGIGSEPIELVVRCNTLDLETISEKTYELIVGNQIEQARSSVFFKKLSKYIPSVNFDDVVKIRKLTYSESVKINRNVIEIERSILEDAGKRLNRPDLSREPLSGAFTCVDQKFVRIRTSGSAHEGVIGFNSPKARRLFQEVQ